MTQPNEQLRIIAQPKALYRERYGSEHFKTGNRVQRYIRAEDNQLNFEYPTIEIRREWSDAALPQYIRVASVTVPNDMESIVCVHPYPIYPDDSSIYKDVDNNAVYFPITNADFINGRKSFLLTRKKLLQSALKLHGPLRIVGSGQSHILGMIKKSRSKHLIETYKLWKSQLLFSRVERVSDGIFNLCTNSSVLSQVMSDETNQQHKDTVVPVVMPSDHVENCGMCVPDKGNWAGGDTILMVLNTLDRDNRPLRLYFYRYNGCLPVAGTPLCQFNVYLIYIPTQINNFLVVQLSIEQKELDTNLIQNQLNDFKLKLIEERPHMLSMIDIEIKSIINYDEIQKLFILIETVIDNNKKNLLVDELKDINTCLNDVYINENKSWQPFNAFPQFIKENHIEIYFNNNNNTDEVKEEEEVEDSQDIVLYKSIFKEHHHHHHVP
ncbi:unnamed protein product [Adineta steineri]|uniref:Uncharacterized protein n=1 Tax=Adineta steineri TaxID=433720 RepID=A0A818XYK0_9BILA|nr:unnamed protein product [Adineta steineri]